MTTRASSARSSRARVLPAFDGVIGEVLVRTIARYGKLQARVAWSLEGTRSFVEGLASEALAPMERARVAERLYGRREAYGQTGLFGWEHAWFQADLPAPPAKVLLGGCGSGREALVLCDMGYEVFACEPVPSLMQAAREVLRGRAGVWLSSYEDWASTPVPKMTRELFSSGPFDAVILGWGSLSHVLDDRVRDSLFPRLVEVCPRGPILFSFMSRSATSEGRMPRARGWGRAMGRLLGRGRAITASTASECFLPHAGFVRRTSEEEVSALASVIGRRPKFHHTAGAPAHCTFLVPHGPPRPPA